jgi:hypothetical protein
MIFCYYIKMEIIKSQISKLLMSQYKYAQATSLCLSEKLIEELRNGRDKEIARLIAEIKRYDKR